MRTNFSVTFFHSLEDERCCRRPESLWADAFRASSRKDPLWGLQTRAFSVGVTAQIDPGLVKLVAEEYPFLLIGNSYY